MKNLIDSLTQVTANRLKSPLIGTFILSWIAINHTFVAKLLFSSGNGRLILIDGRSSSWESDFFCPLGLSILYIFGLPVIQWLVDIGKHHLIDKRRIKTQHEQLKFKHRSLSKVSEEQSKASVEYWDKIHEHRAEEAGKRIIALNNKIASLYDEIATDESEINSLRNEVKITTNENKEYQATIKGLKTDLADEEAASKETQIELNAQKQMISHMYSYNSLLRDSLSQYLGNSIEDSLQEIVSQLDDARKVEPISNTQITAIFDKALQILQKHVGNNHELSLMINSIVVDKETFITAQEREVNNKLKAGELGRKSTKLHINV